MIIYGKHIQTEEKNIYENLKEKFSESNYIEISPQQTDLFEAITGSRKLLGKLLAVYPNGSLSFFIALIKEGEAATVINEQKEIAEVPAPDGSDYFNQLAVINISDDTIYYATIDRFSEFDIKYFIKNVLNIRGAIDFINIADEQALDKIAKYGVNGIDFSLVYNQAYIDHMKTINENKLLSAIREFGTHICGFNNKLCDANYSKGLKTNISINRTPIPKKDKKNVSDINYSDETLKTLAEGLCSNDSIGNDVQFKIRLKNGGGKITDSSLYLSREISVSREKKTYLEMLIQINSHILKFKEQNKEYLLSIKG